MTPEQTEIRSAMDALNLTQPPVPPLCGDMTALKAWFVPVGRLRYRCAKLGHVWGEWSPSETLPTCVNARCSVCDACMSMDATDAGVTEPAK